MISTPTLIQFPAIYTPSLEQIYYFWKFYYIDCRTVELTISHVRGSYSAKKGEDRTAFPHVDEPGLRSRAISKINSRHFALLILRIYRFPVVVWDTNNGSFGILFHPIPLLQYPNVLDHAGGVIQIRIQPFSHGLTNL